MTTKLKPLVISCKETFEDMQLPFLEFYEKNVRLIYALCSVNAQSEFSGCKLNVFQMRNIITLYHKLYV